MESIKNKNVLIVGATGGIGSKVAKLLSGSGANLFLAGRNSEKLAAGGFVAYNIHADEAKKMVDSGDYSAAFLLRETKVREVQDVANAGDKMPQKSTYFYPKLITGLVLRPLD